MRTLKKPLKKALCLLAAGASMVVPYELATATASTVWHPSADASISWVWQLQGTPSLAGHAQMYDIDGFDNTAATVSAIHAQGAVAVCYVDFGTWENWRSDQASFPSSVLGASNGWPGEKWLDIRQISTLAPIMTARMQMCVQKGFDALEPDNIDGYTNSTGFPLSAADQLAYNTWIANTAHSLGLSVGLKNDVDQTSQLEPVFDWALDEQCNQYSECGTEAVFTQADKAVFNAEYGSSDSFCAADIAAHINGARFDLNLDGATDVPCASWGTPTTPTAPTTTATTTVSDPTSTTSGAGVTSTTAAPATTTTTQSVPGDPGPTTSTTTRTRRGGTTSTTARTTTTLRTTTTTSPRRNRRNVVTSTTTSTNTNTTTNTSGHHAWWRTWFSQPVFASSGNGSGAASAAVTPNPSSLATTTTLPKHHRHG
jgi:hypothetical protein